MRPTCTIFNYLPLPIRPRSVVIGLVAVGLGAGRVTVANLPNEPRWYFEMVPDRGDPLIIADRSLHLATAANLRDAGGYRTADGKWVRMGCRTGRMDSNI
jgi:hypothetical protein